MTASDGHTWTLTGVDNQLSEDGITYSNMEVADATDATILGQDDTNETFEIGLTDQSVEVNGLIFNTVSNVDGGSSSGDIVQSNSLRDWTLTGNSKELQAAAITFSEIEFAEFDAAITGMSKLIGSSLDDSFDASDAQNNIITGNDIQFTQTSSVEAGLGNDSVLSDASENWVLTGVSGGVTVNSVQFSDIESAGAKNGTSQTSLITGSSSDELFVLDTANNTTTVSGITFDHIGAVDAGGGADTVDSGAVNNWQAVEQGGSQVNNSIEAEVNSVWVLFANVEEVLNVGTYTGPSIGADYTLTDVNTLTLGGISLDGVTTLNAGSGNDTLYGLNLDTTWTVNGQSGSTQHLNFTGIDSVRAGSGNDVFTFNSGTSGDIHTGAGNDIVNLNGGSVAGLYLEEGSDQVFINSSTSSATILNGGSGTDLLTSNVSDLTWKITGDVSQTNYVGDYAFTGFENLMNGTNQVIVDSAIAAVFNTNRVSFTGSGMNLGFSASGEILFTSSYLGGTAISGSVSADSLEITSASDINLETDINTLNVQASGGRSINVDIQEADDLMIGQVYAGTAGTISLSSMGLGELTAETRGVTHLTANVVNLGTELSRWAAIGEQLNPLRMEVGNSVNIVSLSYVDPEFVNGAPTLNATGDRLESLSGAIASQGLKSAVQNGVVEFTQVDPAIFSEVSSYSIGANSVNSPEYKLVAGELIAAGAIASASGDVDKDKKTLTED
ncbi:hypothetical protein KOI40_14865 [Aestuariicella sp. G3-2]|nr:hypothetical protein [Aestuariicella albida]